MDRTTVKEDAGSEPVLGTDWERLATMTDEEIERAVAADPDAAPVMSRADIMARARLVPPRMKR